MNESFITTFMKKYIITKFILLALFPLFSAGCYFDNLYSYSDVFGQYEKIMQVALLNGEQCVTQWARSTVDIGNTQYNAIAVGSDCIYAAGFITSGQNYFGNSIMAIGVNTEPGGSSAVLVKYDSNGNAQWARTIKLVGTDAYSEDSKFNSIAVGSDGIYAAGVITGTEPYYFSDTVFAAGTCDYDYNVVLVKYDLNGNALWAKSVTAGTDGSSFNSVAVGSDGIYAVGQITGTGMYKFSDTTLPVAGQFAGGSNIVLVKYDFDGNAQWAKSVARTGSATYSLYNSIAVGSDGLYAAGYICGSNLGTFDFGNSTSLKTDLATKVNVLLVKYDLDGNAQWARTEKTPWTGHQEDNSIASYASVSVGNDGIYAAGYISNDFLYDFGNSKTVSGTAGTNMVLVKYDSSGNAQWARSVMTGPNNSSFNSIAVGIDGIYAAGAIYGNGIYDFGASGKVSGSYGGSNIVLVKYDLSGNALWAKSVSGNTHDSQFYSVTACNDGIYAAGYIYGSSTYDFRNSVTVSSNWGFSNHALVVKYR
jgi:hypothetical protein